jgi:UMF1 family MFS transporter
MPLLDRLGLSRPELRAWAMYDWANSAFVTTVVTAVFPIYFVRVAEAGGLEPAQATLRFTLATVLALAVVAVLAPPLGVLADRRPWKKPMLAIFAICGAGATAAMAGIGPGEWRLALALFVAANIGAAASFVFYDALLPHIAGAGEIDQVSTAGYALGYLGGGALLALNLAFITRPEWFGLPDAAAGIRASFASVALWWLVFSLPLLRRVPEPAVVAIARRPLFEIGRDLARHREALRFLVAFLVYSDGIGTIIRLATIYGTEIGVPQSALISAVLLVQFAGIPATFGFGALARRTGAKAAIGLALTVYTGISVLGYFMTSARDFYVLAALLALVQGGCQALSRSLFASLIPTSRSGEFFGVFAVFEKFSGIAGPLLFAAAIWISGSSRAAILSVTGFFLVGGVLLAGVDVTAGRRRAQLDGA